ncbi:MAG: gamma-glutamyl-gamma-aminobutyrate hydrolase family protein [Candidatus Marinimicrobia bacterium]|jgi:putative glutamine amidotransferase|nr:gamma-glutamyl-gamma-aminobutyrate hydrolase family protein [Candidatus Neomarinimicrobiota bacterium]MBT3617343.1 gamma-glutamyl-gamma-aminobutyrate hydrolase family protein [Candidatus Neomarinimicrobiota bacterium]MBT3829283.1 gamma-glutamyl-gamma-aminobutyrate hydrolase family protein [Candidatus Neomarinimicrobiota bacterium]MBT3998241.1 gamma-glutamyl-gamma-aminobutyrate hydrolase family protein [Candidatus Neomarinimicrobiota bacterium]MBT4281542.1 gamma-glutamyl-gamma-aminobutyrate h
MNKPLVGINPYYYEWDDALWNGTKDRYYNAVWHGEGIPFTVHYPDDNEGVNNIADTIDGLIMVGGPDIPNDLYNGKHPELLDKDILHPTREAFDRALCCAMRKRKKPILAICLGMQQINVISGGTLYEDLNVQFKNPASHGEFKGNVAYHSVTINESSLLYQIIGNKTIEVASTHHQGIRTLGKGLKSVATAPDGLIEAIEDKERPEAFIAVQWHPELMPGNPDQLKLFKWLSEEASNRKES